MKPAHLLEAMLVRGLSAGMGALPWATAVRLGARLGALAGALGLRRAVVEDNLAHAFPEQDARRRRALADAFYRQLGRVAAEYLRLPELVRAPEGDSIRAMHGLEHIERALARGKGALLLSGHFGNVELLGAGLTRRGFPVDFVVRRMSNPWVERWVTDLRGRAGVGIIPRGAGVRGVLAALRANRCVSLLADQDARGRGIFVPFFGRLASTPPGPAQLAARTGTPIVMGFAVRGPDLRHELTVLPPLEARAGEPEAREVERLTALHAAALEDWVRRYPDHWFWAHRRWKTRPGGATEA